MNDVTELLKSTVDRLCRWYAENRKPMPWREDPTPYHVWLSEIMLQQTRIEAAIPYYHRFLEELPTVSALASVDDNRLMKLWQGLGYYSRARNLKKAAGEIMTTYGGRIPNDVNTLRSLPGIGDYTAGAIASIAYHLPEPAVDGNVLRVVMRLTACSDDVLQPAVKKAVTESLRAVYPSGKRAALYTEGLMELGELICIPNGSPRCSFCPLSDICRGKAAGDPSAFPTRTVKKERKKEDRAILILSHGLYYAIRKRPAKGLLAGMWEFPNLVGRFTAEEIAREVRRLGLSPEAVTPCGTARHVFTHVEWNMTGYLVRCVNIVDDLTWVTAPEIEEAYAIPAAFRPFLKQLPC